MTRTSYYCYEIVKLSCSCYQCRFVNVTRITHLKSWFEVISDNLLANSDLHCEVLVSSLQDPIRAIVWWLKLCMYSIMTH